jgi:DNA repair photolyase
MSLKKTDGNMYPWVTHTHTHLGGECPHACKYCYAQKGVARMSGYYKGPPRLVEKELKIPYGKGKTIFLEHLNDLFAEGIESSWTRAILSHAGRYPENTYVFQTKNPARVYSSLESFPPSFMLGTTIETNRDLGEFTKAPPTAERAFKMAELRADGIRVFVTVEPVMDFDPEILAGLLHDIKPEFINIGADSKNCQLPEPSAQKVRRFLKLMAGIEIREKTNLRRISEGK